jgi:undecaprenyl-phosphate 4-deoxy-4-formamido-L-arabinose transferase
MQGPASIEFSVVIPVYNSAETVPELIARLVAVLEGLGPAYELILVDDGSQDGSWEALCRLQAGHPAHLTVIQLMRNYGQHNALMCGLRRSRGRHVITLDDDLQTPPEEIPKLVKAIQATDLDLIYGSYETKNHRAWRNAGSALVNLFFRAVFQSSGNITSFRIIKRELLETTFSYGLNFTFLDGLLAWNTQRVGRVPVAHLPRTQGRSGYSLAKLLLLSLNLFTNFSLLPLQAVSACGILASAGGFATGLYYLCQYLLAHITVPGYASLIIVSLVLGGIQLLSLGIMGEYVGRLHLNINHKPQYAERAVLSRREPGGPGGSPFGDRT